MKNSISQMKYSLESTGNRADQMEEKIDELKDKNLEIIEMEEKGLLRFKNVKNPYESYQTPLGDLT